MNRKLFKRAIEITATNIVVGDRYFSFDYFTKIDGVKVGPEKYDSGHSRFDDKEKFKKELEDGYAIDLVIEKL